MDPAYHAFISYSHAADGPLAAALQRGLQRVAKPWWRAQGMKVFRDGSSLAANAALWPELERQLSRSAWLLLMASPASAASPWVGREVAWWLAHRGPQQLLIVLTDGQIVWDAARGDFDMARTDSLPPILSGRFAAEPLHVDLRPCRALAGQGSGKGLDLSHPGFRDAVLSLAAPLRGTPKDELDSDDLRQHRRTRRLALGASALIGGLSLAAGLAGWNAWQASARADHQWRQAQSRALAADAQARLAAHEVEAAIPVALMAWRLAPTDEAQAALAQAGQAGSALAGLLGQHTDGLAAAAFGGDGQHLATVGGEGLVQVWRLGPPVAPAWQRASGLRVARGVQLADQGRRALVWADDGRAEWVDATGGRQVLQEAVWPDATRVTAAVDASGRRVALADDRGRLARWRLADPAARPGRAASAKFTTHTAHTTHTTTNTPTATAGAAQTTTLPGTRVLALAYRPDGRLWLLLQQGQAVRAAQWPEADTDSGSGRGPAPVLGPPTPADHTLAYAGSADVLPRSGRVVVEGDGTGHVFDLAEPARLRPVARVSSLPTNACQSLWPADDGARLFVRRMDTWQTLDTAHPDTPLVQAAVPGRFGCSLFSADGHWRLDLGLRHGPRGEALFSGASLWDRRDAHPTHPPLTVAGACDFRQAGQRCAERLCARLAPAFDEARLRALFGIEDFVPRYERYRQALGGPLCPG